MEMLSAKLLQRIEHNWEKIALAAVLTVREDARVRHYGALDERELRTRTRSVVNDLGLWLTGQDTTEIQRRYVSLGQLRFEQRFPLAEVVMALQLIERKLVEYVQTENAAGTAVDIYSELEMIRALHQFFSMVQHSVVAGYEEAAKACGAWRLQGVAVA
jgi:hypothetical protein